MTGYLTGPMTTINEQLIVRLQMMTAASRLFSVVAVACRSEWYSDGVDCRRRTLWNIITRDQLGKVDQLERPPHISC